MSINNSDFEQIVSHFSLDWKRDGKLNGKSEWERRERGREGERLWVRRRQQKSRKEIIKSHRKWRADLARYY